MIKGARSLSRGYKGMVGMSRESSRNGETILGSDTQSVCSAWLSDDEEPDASDDDYGYEEFIDKIEEVERLKAIIEAKNEKRGVYSDAHQGTQEHKNKLEACEQFIALCDRKTWNFGGRPLQLNDPHDLSKLLRRGGTNLAPRLISCLCVRVHRRDVPAKFKGARFMYTGSDPVMKKGTFGEKSREFWEKIAPYRNHWPHLRKTPPKREIAFYFCGVPEVLDVHQHFDHTLHMLKLFETGGEDKLCNSIFAHIFLHRTWNLVYPSFCLERLRDLLFLSLLMHAAQRSRKGEHPHELAVAGMLMIAVLNTIGQASQFFTFYREFGTLRDSGDGFWTLLPMIIHLYLLMVTICMATCTNFYSEHRVFLAYTIMATWIHLMMSLLAIPKLGKTLLPACQALGDSDSIYFLLFLGIFAVGSSHVYYSLPVAECWHNAFLTMFRLIALGDMDVNELEGQDALVVAPFKAGPGETAGEIRNQGLTKFRSFNMGATGPDDPAYWKTGMDPRSWDASVQSLLMIISSFATIGLMNVYIGVLGSAYEDAKKNVAPLFNSWRSQFMLNLLLRRKLWHDLWPRFTLEYWLRPQDEDIESNDASYLDTWVGMWIVVPNDGFPDEAIEEPKGALQDVAPLA